MKHLLICLSVLLALVSSAPAQLASDDQAKRSDEILKKMRQIDLLNQMLPLALSKDQINKLLPSIEKARQRVKDQQKEEFKLMTQYEGKIDAAVKAGIDKGDVPDIALLRELNAVMTTMELRRDAVASENADAVLSEMKKALNAGQLKVAANSLNPKLFDPSVKVDEMTQDQKILFFVRNIMLDPHSYDLMRQLLKRAS
jgi:hypothetical protein